jgi:Zn-finger nucleic acid-binding protein
MRCVKCEGTLVPVRVEDVDLDQCRSCAGIWFDAHELERILRRKHIEPILGRARATPGDDERRGHCPRCKGEGYLVRIASPAEGVHIDTCAICGGKWLDGGEIDLLERATHGHRLRRLLEWVLDLDLP